MILFTVSPATAEATISAMMGSTMYKKSAHGRGLALLLINQHARVNLGVHLLLEKIN
jgi:hypothetical protein